MGLNSQQKEMSIKKAALINAGAKYSNALFMLIANAILARLLSAEEYGILAIITVFVTFFNLFSDMGFSAGVIQNKELDDNDINNIFSFTIYLGVFLCIVFWGISYITSIIYDNNVFIGIGFLLSISILFHTLNMIPNAKLMREKRFVLVAIRSVVVYIVSYVIAIILAYCDFSYYSLVVQSIVAAVTTFFWNFTTAKMRIRFHFELSSIKKIFSYSVFNFLYDILNCFGRNLDNLLTGKFMGSQVLGYYNKAYQLMLYPVSYLTNVITPVLHPMLSDHQTDKDYIYQKYVRILKGLSLIGIMASCFCIFEAREIVLILYGKKWESTIPCIAILGGSVWFQMVTSTCTSIFKSLGESKLRFNSGIVYVIIQILMIAMGVSSKDIVILAVFVAVSFVIRFFIECYYLVHRAFCKSLIAFYKMFIPEVIVFCGLSMIMIGLNMIVKINQVFLAFLIKSICSSIAFLVLIIATKQIHFLLDLLPRKYTTKIAKWRLQK